MPYIKPSQRSEVSFARSPESAGELNYAISMLCSDYWKEQDANYQAINDIVGALEGAKLEFYRRIAAPYEDLKIQENGDVY